MTDMDGQARPELLRRDRAASSAGPDQGEIEVRPARSEDRDVIRALTAAASGGVAEWAEHLDGQIARSDRDVVVAVAGGEVVAYGRSATFDPAEFDPADFDVEGPWTAPAGWYLLGVFVEPRWRRRGIARALVRVRLEWLSTRAHEAFYFTNAENRASLALHHAFGFVELTRDFTFPGEPLGDGEYVLCRVELAGTGPPQGSGSPRSP